MQCIHKTQRYIDDDKIPAVIQSASNPQQIRHTNRFQIRVVVQLLYSVGRKTAEQLACVSSSNSAWLGMAQAAGQTEWPLQLLPI